MVHNTLIFIFSILLPALFPILIYLFTAYCLMRIAEKTDTKKKWYAFVPLLNFYLMSKIAKKPWWWAILFLIPFVNLLVMVLVGIEIVKRLNKSWWIGILLAVPVLQLFIWGYLAFSKEKIELEEKIFSD